LAASLFLSGLSAYFTFYMYLLFGCLGSSGTILQAATSWTGNILMMLIVWYVLFMVIGDLIAYFLGAMIEHQWGSQVSLIAFLILYFMALWVAWLLAVWVTKPKQKHA
jgi:cation transporter-like permease